MSIIVSCSCNSKMHFVNQPTDYRIHKILKSDSAHIFSSIEGITKNNALYFDRNGIILANPGKIYNTSDLNFGIDLPNARLIFGGEINKNISFVLYASGNIESQSHLVVFDGSNPITIAIETKILNCRPLYFVDLQECLQQKKWLR